MGGGCLLGIRESRLCRTAPAALEIVAAPLSQCLKTMVINKVKKRILEGDFIRFLDPTVGGLGICLCYNLPLLKVYLICAWRRGDLAKKGGVWGRRRLGLDQEVSFRAMVNRFVFRHLDNP